jgi:hypothetical protein
MYCVANFLTDEMLRIITAILHKFLVITNEGQRLCPEKKGVLCCVYFWYCSSCVYSIHSAVQYTVLDSKFKISRTDERINQRELTCC